MLKSGIILLYALLSTPVLSKEFALKQTHFTREWSTRTYSPVVLKLNNHLLTVTKSSISINLTSTDPSFKPCQIPVDPETDGVTSNLRARTLGNGKVVTGGVTSSPSGKKGYKTVNYITFVIDPQSCSAKRLTTLVDEVPDDWPQYWGSLVTYQNSFDVFFPTYNVCSPCRFSDKGDKIELDYRLVSDGYGQYDWYKSYRKYSIDTMEVNDPSKGYFFAYQDVSSFTRMKVLNERFETTNTEEFWTRWLDSTSVTKGHTGYCAVREKTQKEPYDDSADCFLADREWNSTAGSARLFLPGEGRVARTAISVLEDGSAWIAIDYAPPKPRPAQIHVVKMKPVNVTGLPDVEIYYPEAEVSDHVEFQRISGNYPFEMKTIVLAEELCVVTVEQKESPEDYDEAGFNLTVKCMAASD